MGLLTDINLKDFDLGKIFSGIGELAKDVREVITGKVIIDPNKTIELETKLAELERMSMAAQTRINEIEAASPKLFVSGWRPAAGWLTVCGLAWSTFIVPIWTWIASLAKIAPPPIIDTGVLVSLLIGMLGLGAYRTFEKTRNGKAAP